MKKDNLYGWTLPVLDHGHVRLVDWMGTDQRIVEAARISYNSPSKGEEQDKKLLEYLYKNKHTSPFEMCKITMDIKLPIFAMRQYVRHRMQNLNEVSARYTELPNEFYIPTKWRKQDIQNKQSSSGEFDDDANFAYTDCLTQHCKESYNIYKSLLEDGVSREMARMFLPVNIYTHIYTCWDLKNLLHFITLRDDSHAQYEIQEYGKAIKTILTELFPVTMEAYEKYKWQLTD